MKAIRRDHRENAAFPGRFDAAFHSDNAQPAISAFSRRGEFRFMCLEGRVNAPVLNSRERPSKKIPAIPMAIGLAQRVPL
jgi:hypothetical protein